MQLHCCSKHWHKADLSMGAWVVTRWPQKWSAEHSWRSYYEIYSHKTYWWSAFSSSLLGSCSLCAAQCSILRIPMQNSVFHPNACYRANRQSQINHIPAVSVRRAQYTAVKGDSELKYPRVLTLLSVTVKCSLVCCKKAPLLNLTPFFYHCLGHRLLEASDFWMALPSDAQKSPQHLTWFVMREGSSRCFCFL